MEKSREDLVYLAKLSEQAEKYGDMVAAMIQVAHQNPSLTLEERSLLSVAFKNIVGHSRASQRIISSLEAKETAQNNENNVVRIQKYREHIEGEIRHHSQTLLELIENYLIPAAQDQGTKVFYYKLQGDYWRYLAEIETNEARKYATDQSQKQYDLAFKFVESLPPLHPVRLGLCLNFSVFCYELLGNVNQAQNIIGKLHEDIMAKMTDASEEELTEIEPILRVIQNLPPLFNNNIMDDEHEVTQYDTESGHRS